MQNQLANLTNMMSKFMSSNTASSSGSGTFLVSEPVVAPVNAPMPNLKPSTPYPSRRDNERCRDQANDQIKKFYEIFKYMSFEISFMDALMLMPKFASTLKALIGNKEKLSEMARTPMNEHYRSVSKPIGIAKDVSVKVGVFHFSADFVVVDFEPDPRVLLILERCFLKTDRALIDVHKGELTLRIGNEAITYNLVQTSRYSANYDQMTANKIDVTDEACEEYSQEFSVSPMLPRVAVPLLLTIQLSPPLLLRSLHLGIAISYFLRKPTLFSNELKACEAKTIKSSIEEPPEVELKDLPPHLEYAFLEGDNKLPVIIAKDLGNEEKSALIKDAKARLLRWVLLLQEFDFDVINTKGSENLAADYLSRLENSYENVLDPKEINETFPLETLRMVTFRGDSGAPWFEDFTNYHAGNFIVK
nr:reverse transcriptase domain-containing protein [Tanacetum cinerariifolium]